MNKLPSGFKTQPSALDLLMQELSRYPPFQEALLRSSQNMASLSVASDGQRTLTTLRMLSGLSVIELAQAAGIEYRVISGLESGELALDVLQDDTVVQLCHVLKCDRQTLAKSVEASQLFLASHRNF